MTRTIFLAFGLAFAGTALSQTAPSYGQCGGTGWSGPTTCPSGWTCTFSNQWYSQCLPGAATTTSFPGSGTTTIDSSPGGGISTTKGPGGPAPTLTPGWNFIRAVTSPNFHKYLQSEVPNTVSDAVLGEAVTAAQFQITDGQLIHKGDTPLYAVVEPRANSTVSKLKVSWSKSKDTLGAFKFSGDTVEWTSSAITRPQSNAWLICADSKGNRHVYINLGPYGYQTPNGCNDHTIHGFTGTTPD
ncbi:4-O-methyl-glucuronoyl methylesterase [Psilocybe cubensis]|uniref:4-O-methyl-glucuronoyl methylesterase n=2 Tax=Psilocybe cubensis TaxID=181762 RepID=A0ACB8GGT6_PSICU|nr:4-O-methyl-glucuronoyl methylesterase [Psilocybe cubensis]KAH9474645.1 4-O-methyl-glucuronoyl methylesterase [Psilocybe cubensis]